MDVVPEIDLEPARRVTGAAFFATLRVSTAVSSTTVMSRAVPISSKRNAFPVVTNAERLFVPKFVTLVKFVAPKRIAAPNTAPSV